MANKDSDQIKSDMNQLLDDMERAGFSSRKGSNTYTLAAIVTDFIHKTINKRKQDLSMFNLWETQDLSILAPVMFNRYRLYNERSTPTVYDISGVVSSESKSPKFLDPVPGFYQLKYLGNGCACHADIYSTTIARLTNDKPSKIGVKYSEILAGGTLTQGKREFVESFMSETGVYHEKDFVILPDLEGNALFYPITDFSRHKGTLKLTLIVRPKTHPGISLPVIKEPTEVTPDLLKFTLTQLLSKFPVYRGMQLDELYEFIRVKYNKEMSLKGTEICTLLSDSSILELRDFAKLNVFGNVTVTKPLEHFIVLKPHEWHDQTIHNSVIDYVQSNLSGLEEVDSLKEKVYKLVDDWFVKMFGLDANFAKSKNKIMIEIQQDVHFKPSELHSSVFTKCEVLGNDFQ